MRSCRKATRKVSVRPVALRHVGRELVPARCPAAQTRHVGLGSGLIDEDQASRIKLVLIRLPPPTP